MSKIYNIKFVDAYYTFAKKVGKTKLSFHEAYGYIKKNGNNIIVVFIKKILIYGKNEIVLGLVIPSTALISKKNNAKNKLLTNHKIGDAVAITWRDIVIFDSGNLRNNCSIMYTKGILFKINRDHIVLKNPETIRIYPAPIKNHPTKKPSFYIIPISFITKISTTNNI